MWQDNLWKRRRGAEYKSDVGLFVTPNASQGWQAEQRETRRRGGEVRVPGKNANIFYVGQVEWICWVSLAQNAKWSGSKEFHTMWTDQQQFMFPLSPLSLSLPRLSLALLLLQTHVIVNDGGWANKPTNKQANKQCEAKPNETKRREEKTQINQKISAHCEDRGGEPGGAWRVGARCDVCKDFNSKIT